MQRRALGSDLVKIAGRLRVHADELHTVEQPSIAVNPNQFLKDIHPVFEAVQNDFLFASKPARIGDDVSIGVRDNLAHSGRPIRGVLGGQGIARLAQKLPPDDVERHRLGKGKHPPLGTARRLEHALAHIQILHMLGIGNDLAQRRTVLPLSVEIRAERSNRVGALVQNNPVDEQRILRRSQILVESDITDSFAQKEAVPNRTLDVAGAISQTDDGILVFRETVSQGMGVVLALEEGELANENVDVVLLVVEKIHGIGKRFRRPLVVTVQAGDDAPAGPVEAGVARRGDASVGLLVKNDVGWVAILERTTDGGAAISGPVVDDNDLNGVHPHCLGSHRFQSLAQILLGIVHGDHDGYFKI